MPSDARGVKSGRRRPLDLSLLQSSVVYTPSFSDGTGKTRKRFTLEAERKENLLSRAGRSSASLPDISDYSVMNRRVTPTTNTRRGFLGLSNGPVTSSVHGGSRRHLAGQSPRSAILSPDMVKSATPSKDTNLDFFDSRVRPTAPVRAQVVPSDFPQKKVSTGSANHMSLDNWLKSLPDTVTTTTTSRESPGDQTVNIDDIEDEEEETGGCIMDSRVTPLRTSSQGRPISVEVARDLKTLMFGQPSQMFPPGWLGQAFVFNSQAGLSFGLVQDRGGPCGVMAAVQGSLLKVLLHGSERFRVKASSQQSLEAGLSLKQRTVALAAALAEVLVRCRGEEEELTVVMSGMRKHFTSAGRLRADGLTETANIFHFSSEQELWEFLCNNSGFFIGHGNSAVVCFLYSCILTRGVDNIRADMDSRDSHLMAAHGYCSQEMVNLVTTGVAASNVFDNKVVLGSDKDQTVLKGVEKQSEVGLLSLFEHYKSCSVGSHLKSPVYPIWLVCSESHFTTLWASGNTKELCYYDGLSGQESLIHLSLDTEADLPDSQITSSIEFCIRTKWPGASIGWNGAEKLL